jgi:hypothetical protein
MNYTEKEGFAEILGKLTPENKIRLLNRARFCLDAQKSAQTQAGGEYPRKTKEEQENYHEPR